MPEGKVETSKSCTICDVTYLFACTECGRLVCEDCMEGPICTDCAEEADAES